MNLEQRITALEKRVAELERQVGVQPHGGIRPRVSRYSQPPLGGTETKSEKAINLEELKKLIAQEDRY